MGRVLKGQDPVVPPPTTMLGGLFRYLRESAADRFQPMNSNWGLVDPLNRRVKDKVRKREMLAARAQADFIAWMEANGIEASGIEASGVNAGGTEANGIEASGIEAPQGSSTAASFRPGVPPS